VTIGCGVTSIMKIDFNMRAPLLALFLVPFLGCSSSSGSSSPSSAAGPAPTALTIVAVSGAPLTAVAGDALALKVVDTFADGSTQDLPAGAKVTWGGPPTVTATAPDATPAANPYPASAATRPTAMWIANPARSDVDPDLEGLLFVLDAGSAPGGQLTISASVTGGPLDGQTSATVAVAASPDGDATRGARLYGATGANCSECHGATAKGSPANADGATYEIDGMSYSFPAPPIDAESGNAAAEWSAPLFAIASRADLDDGAVTLRSPMPSWLTTPNPATGKLLTTQDFADIFAFLETQQ
jgi:mono/diheme cytochrome c family protein